MPANALLESFGRYRARDVLMRKASIVADDVERGVLTAFDKEFTVCTRILTNFSASVDATCRAISLIAGSQYTTPRTKQSRGNRNLSLIDKSSPTRSEIGWAGSASAHQRERTKLSLKADSPSANSSGERGAWERRVGTSSSRC